MAWPLGRKITAWCLVLIVFAASAFFVYGQLLHAPVRRSSRVLLCESEQVSFSVTLPPGRHYSWVLSVPGERRQPGVPVTSLVGTSLRFWPNDCECYSVTIPPGHPTTCSWLWSEAPSDQAIILMDRFELSTYVLQEGFRLRTEILFPTRPKPGTALWLVWTQESRSVPRSQKARRLEEAAMAVSPEP